MNLIINSIADVYLTLTDKQTLPAPNYLFRFVQRTTNCETVFLLKNADDVSPYKERYNLFNINVDQHFAGQIGEYHYYVYEEPTSYNTDVCNTGKLLEHGVMRLEEPADCAYTFTTYDTDNTYITR